MSEHSDREVVRAHYEEFPYPARDPEDERRRLVQDPLSQLALVDHLFWGGRWHGGGGLRVLDAGCGTGDSVICLAEQLRGSGGRIVALDVSEASLAVAAARARVRGLAGIEFVHGSIEGLPSLGLGEFDYVVAPGVLHHLASPEEGLSRLAETLAPDGGLGVRVYGRYGRAGVSRMRELLRILAPPGEPTSARLRTARRLLVRLSREHPASVYADEWERELRENGGPDGDAALGDLFLHPRERAYTVPELYDWLDGSGLRLTAFDPPGAYEPGSEFDATHLSVPERHALAELLNGRMGHHRFFAQRATAPAPPRARRDDESAVPMWVRFDPEGERDRLLEEGVAVTGYSGETRTRVPLTPVGVEILRRVDGQRPLRDILDCIGAVPGTAARSRARREWERLHRELGAVSHLVLNPPPDATRSTTLSA